MDYPPGPSLKTHPLFILLTCLHLHMVQFSFWPAPVVNNCFQLVLGLVIIIWWYDSPMPTSKICSLQQFLQVNIVREPGIAKSPWPRWSTKSSSLVVSNSHPLNYWKGWLQGLLSMAFPTKTVDDCLGGLLVFHWLPASKCNWNLLGCKLDTTGRTWLLVISFTWRLFSWLCLHGDGGDETRCDGRQPSLNVKLHYSRRVFIVICRKCFM